MSTNDVDQAIQRLAEVAASLTLDQRLRIAALLARPIEPMTATRSPSNPVSDRALTESLVLTVDEAAEFLKVGRTTVYDLLRTRQLNSIMIGRLRRIRHTDLTAYLGHIDLDENSR